MSGEAEAARLAWAAMKARMNNDGEAVIDRVTELSEQQLAIQGMMMMLHTVHGFATMCASIIGTSPAGLWAGFTEGIAAQAQQSQEPRT